MIRYRQLGKILDARSPVADDAIVAGRVRRRVDRIDDQVRNDLLKLGAIADNRKCRRSDAGLSLAFEIQGVGDLRLRFTQQTVHYALGRAAETGRCPGTLRNEKVLAFAVEFAGRPCVAGSFGHFANFDRIR